MQTIHKGDYVVFYDTEFGVVYAPKLGSIKSTTSTHAKCIEKYLEMYQNNELSNEEQHALELYFDKNFVNKEKVSRNIITDLHERKSIRRIEILVANDCNMNCKYCYAHGGNYGVEKELMTVDNVRRYLDNLIIGKFSNVGFVLFFGGEPTLCPDVIEEVCLFFYKNYESHNIEALPIFQMVSNGTLIDEKMAGIIKKYSIRVTISIDGPKEINDILRVDRNGNGSYDRIVKGLNLLSNIQSPPVLFEATYTSLHSKMGFSKKGIQKYLQDNFDVDDVMIADCSLINDNNHLNYTEQNVFETQTETLLNSFKWMDVQSIQSKKIDGFNCNIAFDAFTLVPNGDVYPCHMFLGQQEYRIATFKDGIYDFSQYEDIKEKFINADRFHNEMCKECWAKYICQVCPATILAGKECDDLIKVCEREKNIHKRIILDFAKTQVGF